MAEVRIKINDEWVTVDVASYLHDKIIEAYERQQKSPPEKTVPHQISKDVIEKIRNAVREELYKMSVSKKDDKQYIKVFLGDWHPEGPEGIRKEIESIFKECGLARWRRTSASASTSTWRINIPEDEWASSDWK